MSTLRPKFEQNLGWLILALVFAGCLLTLMPFLSPLLWAVVLSSSCWPLYRRLVKLLGGRRTLTALLLALALVCVILLPFMIVVVTLADNVKDLAAAAQRWMNNGLPAPPEWLIKVPVVGIRATNYWQAAAADNAWLMESAQKFIGPVSGWLLKTGMGFGRGLAELALSILIVFFLFCDGGRVADRGSIAIERIAGERGKHLLNVAGGTVQGVVYGILGTALLQALMAGAGFFFAGVPGGALLAFLTFFLSPIPAGPILVFLPVVLWLFHHGAGGWGVFMIIWGVVVSSIDNFIRPWLISQGSDMPFLLIFFGVIGGATAFGLIGVVLGPTLLAVGYRLVLEWNATKSADATVPDP